LLGVEALESRTFMSVTPPLPVGMPSLPNGAPGALNQLVKATQKAGIDISQLASITIPKLTQNLTLDAATGNLVGTVNAIVKGVGGATQSLPIQITLDPQGTECPILDLHLGPIDLNLLGLRVQTSEICLDVHAEPGPGNLLGNLLCDITNLLNGPIDLGAVTSALNQLLPLSLNFNLTGFSSQGDNLLALGNLTLSGGGGSTSTPFSSPVVHNDAVGGVCNILNLSLGPVNLDLLGLDVNLDNCHNGPVTVKVTAIPGPGNLVGNLLCGVTHLLDDVPLSQIVRRLNGLLDQLA